MTSRLRPIIRVFVSSTFGDLQKERNILQADVFPALERYCAEREFQFQAIDLRWGVPGEAGLDHRTMRICFDELRRSQQISPKPNFLVLLGDRYGWQPLPEEISEKEHADLEQAARELEAADPPKWVPNARQILAQWYLKDENADPLVFVLCSRHEPRDGRNYAKPVKDNPNWEPVQQVLWAIINQAYPAMDRPNRFVHIPKLSEPLPSIVKFQASATEQEIWRGALAVEDAAKHVVAWFRDIRKPEQYRTEHRAEDFFDREFFQGDDGPWKAAQELRKALEGKLGKKIRPAAVSLREPAEKQKPLDRENQRLEVTDEHLLEMCRSIQEELTQIIDQEISEYWKPRKLIVSNTPKREDSAAQEPAFTTNPFEPRKLELEQEAHEQFGGEREANFVGREQELEAITKYLGDEDRKPLVVYGASGTGKTALLARAAKAAKGSNRKVITRYLGITPRCSNLRDLLVNLCHELREPGIPPPSLPIDMTTLQAEFDRLLVAAGKRQPILLFLDSLDQLDQADNARETYWLRSPLPPNVKEVISCLWDPDLERPSYSDVDEGINAASGGTASANRPYLSLQRRNLLERAIAVTSLSAPQAKELLGRWLFNGDLRRPERRQLTRNQWKVVEAHICSPRATSRRRPLYLRVLFEECRLWPSWKDVMSDELGMDTTAQLVLLLHRLSEPLAHGAGLVSTVLGYLAAARRGMSENELLEVLWDDPDYKAHLDKVSAEYHHELPKDAKRIPIALWSRLRFDLDPYLAERAASGTTVMHFYHRQVAQVVREQYLAGEIARTLRHRRLAEFFAKLDGQRRSIEELPWQLEHSAQWQRLKDVLTQPNYLAGMGLSDEDSLRRMWAAIELHIGTSLRDGMRPLLGMRSTLSMDTLVVIEGLGWTTGNLEIARESAEEMIRRLEPKGDSPALAAFLKQLADIHERLGHWQHARDLLDQAQQISQRLNDQDGTASILLSETAACMACQDYESALACARRATEISRKTGNLRSLRAALTNCAACLTCLDRPDEARTIHIEEEAITREMEDWEGLARSLNNQGGLEARYGAPELALAMFTRADQLATQYGLARSQVIAVAGQAHANSRLNKWGLAFKTSQRARKRSEELGDSYLLAHCVMLQAALFPNFRESEQSEIIDDAVQNSGLADLLRDALEMQVKIRGDRLSKRGSSAITRALRRLDV